MKHGLFLWICLLAGVPAWCQVDTSQQIITGRKNSTTQQNKPYVILISADGFRYDYAEKFNAQHLLALRDSGVKAPYMIPSFPTLTFPNHYAMVSGLYPSHSGIAGNNFYDPQRHQAYRSSKKKIANDGSWYKGTPLWVLAEKQQMISASFYWVGSEAEIQGTYPTYYYNYNEKIQINDRINTVVNWLKLPPENRPHFISFYLPQVDHESHHHSPISPETEKAVLFVDSVVNELTKAVKTTGLDVNFIFVSDHGMANVDYKNPVEMTTDMIDTARYVVNAEAPLIEMYAKPGTNVKADYKKLKKQAKGKPYDVYLKKNIPRHLYYNAANDRYNRIGDIVLLARAPAAFHFGNYSVHPGQHGYDVKQTPEMRATFYAWGPAFKKHATVKPFNNVDIYSLICNILGLDMPANIDGSSKLAEKVLVKH